MLWASFGARRYAACMSRKAREEIERIASLARLRLDPSECESMARHLVDILELFEQLHSVSTEGVLPTTQIFPAESPMRDDSPSRPINPVVALRDSPSTDGTSFSVPRVFDGKVKE